MWDVDIIEVVRRIFWVEGVIVFLVSVRRIFSISES